MSQDYSPEAKLTFTDRLRDITYLVDTSNTEPTEPTEATATTRFHNQALNAVRTEEDIKEVIAKTYDELLEAEKEEAGHIWETPAGMPKSIFEGKYSRVKETVTAANGEKLRVFQSWEERVREVVGGNLLLGLSPELTNNSLTYEEVSKLYEYAARGLLPFSGRHLQQGDWNQPLKTMEKFTNCSSALASFMVMKLGLDGAGIGSDYSTAVRRVDWDNAPQIRPVLSYMHPDFGKLSGHMESLEEAREKYPSESDRVRWFDIEDSCEGWVRALAAIETAAFHEKHREKLFVFNFSNIRCEGSPIKGQQGRPASGPIPLMKAFMSISSIKGSGMQPWKQAMWIDHAVADCVVMGGVRRIARIATKWWRDRDIFDFIEIKRSGNLWTANNSILVDKDFWEERKDPRTHAARVFQAATAALYHDQSGEPGFISVDRIHQPTPEEVEEIDVSEILNKEYYDTEFHPKTYEMMEKITSYAIRQPYQMIINPCVTGDAIVQTAQGLKKVEELYDKNFNKHASLVTEEDLTVDYVVNGKIVKGTPFFATGQKSVYKIKTAEGYTLRVTAHHKILIKSRNGKSMWVKAKDLTYRDKIVLHDQRGFTNSNIDKGAFQQQSVAISATEKAFTHQDVISSFNTQPSFFDDEERALVKNAEPKGFEFLHFPDEVLYGTYQDLWSFISNIYDNYSYVGVFDHTTLRLICTRKSAERMQIALAAFGITSSIKETVKNFYELHLNEENIVRFTDTFTITSASLKSCLDGLIETFDFDIWKEGYIATFVQLDFDGQEHVYDCYVPGPNAFSANGIYAHNCAEIPLATYGGFCTVSEVNMMRAKTEEEFIDAVRKNVRFLIRVNTMKSIYKYETDRTNRIGTSLLGIHEAAYINYSLTFRNLIEDFEYLYNADIETLKSTPRNSSSPVSLDFWLGLRRASDAANDEAIKYSKSLGKEPPVTVCTIKPGGTVSKTMATTECANLPPFTTYLRWVQEECLVTYGPDGSFQYSNPKVQDLSDRGYPVKDISFKDNGQPGYSGKVVVGFPTKLPIVDLMGAENVVCATDVSMTDHYKWLMLLEKFWLGGIDKDGRPVGNQVSYTLKIGPGEYKSYNDFAEDVAKWQPLVRCCSFDFSQSPEVLKSVYVYVPEEPITYDVYTSLMNRINNIDKELYDNEQLQCSSGICPIEPDQYFE